MDRMITGEESSHIPKTEENYPQYTKAMMSDDEWTSKIVAEIRELNLYDKTLMYTAVDHGFDEGKTSPERTLDTKLRNGESVEGFPFPTTVATRFTPSADWSLFSCILHGWIRVSTGIRRPFSSQPFRLLLEDQ